jgi:hypothetical protein
VAPPAEISPKQLDKSLLGIRTKNRISIVYESTLFIRKKETEMDWQTTININNNENKLKT